MKKKIVFIGNSIVNGYPFSRSKSFPSRVRTALKENPINGSPMDVIGKGVNGDTTHGILMRFHEDVISHNPDFVFVMTGTNDFIYGESSPAEAFANLEKMRRALEESSASGTSPVMVYMTPLPVDAAKAEVMWLAGLGISYAAVNRRIDELSDLIRTSGVPFVDTNRAFKEFIEALDDGDAAYIDGIHPQQAGQEHIAKVVTAWITSFITN